MPSSKNHQLDILFYFRSAAKSIELSDDIQKNYAIQTENNTEKALQAIIEHQPRLLITEEFSRKKDIGILRILRKLSKKTIVIKFVHSIGTHEQYEKKFGLIYDAIPPEKQSQAVLPPIIEQALQYQNELQQKLQLPEHSPDALRKELEWMIWKERQLIHSGLMHGQMILETISHSIFQGMGIGGIVPMAELAKMSSQEDGDNYLIPKAIFDSLLTNIQPLQTLKQKLDFIVAVIDRGFAEKYLPPKQAHKEFQRVVEQMHRFTSLKQQNIHSNDFLPTETMAIHPEFFRMMVREILTNCLKYSPDQSDIYIYTASHDGYTILLFMNSVLKYTRGISGIPQEIEYEIFQPFYRVNHNFDERFYDEEIGLGLGLTIVRELLEKMEGKIYLYEAIDYVTSEEPEKKVITEIIIKNTI